LRFGILGRNSVARHFFVEKSRDCAHDSNIIASHCDS
jgi:hypothetical protein